MYSLSQEFQGVFKKSGVCVKSLEVLKTVCLDKDVLYTALITVHTLLKAKSQ